MLDSSGKVVGVLSFKLRGAESLNFCIPVNYARGMLATTATFSLEEFSQKLGRSKDLFSGRGDSPLPSRWKSLASGTIKVVRVDADRIYVQTIFPDDQQPPPMSTAQLTRAGDSYVGTVRFAALCSYTSFTAFVGQEEKTNHCTLDDRIEISVLTPTRIEGQVMAYPSNAKFDCGKCSYKGTRSWQPFTWIPE